jgi:hypothetical protein
MTIIKKIGKFQMFAWMNGDDIFKICITTAKLDFVICELKKGG